MQMTDEEIVRSYKQAKVPGKQITILAQLNGTSTVNIKEILERNGAMAGKTKKTGLVSKQDFEEIIQSVDEKKPSKRKYTRKKDATSLCIVAKETAEKLKEISIEEGKKASEDREDIGIKLPETIREALDHEIFAINSKIADLALDIERAKAARDEIEEYLRANS